MDTFTTRAGRWPLAITRVSTIVGIAALTACADDPVAPTATARIPGAPALAFEEVTFTVTNGSGGSQVGSLQWAVAQANEPGPTTGVIVFDTSLEGDTITLDSPLQAQRPMQIVGPAKGLTLSGNDQHRVITGGTSLVLRNLTLMKGLADLGSAVMAPSLSLFNTTVQDNRGTASAVYASNALTIVNSTVSRNIGGRAAVEYGPSANVTIDNSTIAYNAPYGLGVISYPSSALTVKLRNSILANNATENCSSFFNFAYEGKVISSDWSCGEVGLTIADPVLQPLAFNGGPNMTHAISYTSPAYNAGTGCTQTTDQRYVARDAKCDVGAFEFNALTTVAITIDPTVRLEASGAYALLTGKMTCTRAETIPLHLELRQAQKVGKTVVYVHTAALTHVACSTTTTTWASKMFLNSGTWQAGAAQATANTVYTPDWVAPASVTSAVKLAVVRK